MANTSAEATDDAVQADRSRSSSSVDIIDECAIAGLAADGCAAAEHASNHPPRSSDAGEAGSAHQPGAVVWDAQRRVVAVEGRTWSGIQFGESPRYAHSFLQYVDALRSGNLAGFARIEAVDGDWWHVTLDRGQGAALHFAAEHGQLECVRYLVEQAGAEVNQLDRARGWTPLLRCARVAHVTSRPYLQVFEYLLSRGADPDIVAQGGEDDALYGSGDQELTSLRVNRRGVTVYDVCVDKGRGWTRGEVRATLQSLVAKYASVSRKPSFCYKGPDVGPVAARVLESWEQLHPVLPPENWRPAPGPGFPSSQGMRPFVIANERALLDGDLNVPGSSYMRPMSEVELDAQARRK